MNADTLRLSPLFFLALFVLSSETDARAEGALGKTGEPLQTSNYNIDLYRGPVLAGSRVTALAGSYEAIAEGVSGYRFNPAAVAVRVPWSTTWFDWEVDGGFTLPGSITQYDFDNNGDDSFNSDATFFGTAGLGLQFGDFGIGLQVNLELYQVDSTQNRDLLNLTAVELAIIAGYSLLDGELVVGASILGHDIGIDRGVAADENSTDSASIAAARGAALGLGVLWAPSYAPLRVGLSTRIAAPSGWMREAKPLCRAPRCVQVGGDYIADGTYYLPRSLSLPTEIRAGVAVQFLRRMNLPWKNPHENTKSEIAQAKSRITFARNTRRELLEKSKDDAKKRGDSTDALEEEFEIRENRLQAAEDEWLAKARTEERLRRLGPYKKLRREKVLLTAGVKVTLPSEDSIGLDSFLQQVVERSGEYITAQPHLAVETEVWPNYLVARVGSYLEPSRFAKGLERVHFTAGFDVHIPFKWDIFGILTDEQSFRVGGAVDYTARYLGWGLSAGIWR